MVVGAVEGGGMWLDDDDDDAVAPAGVICLIFAGMQLTRVLSPDASRTPTYDPSSACVDALLALHTSSKSEASSCWLKAPPMRRGPGNGVCQVLHFSPYSTAHKPRSRTDSSAAYRMASDQIHIFG